MLNQNLFLISEIHSGKRMVLKSLNKNIEKIMTEIKVGFIFSHIMLSIKKTLLLLVVDQYSGVLPELAMAFETLPVTLYMRKQIFF